MANPNPGSGDDAATVTSPHAGREEIPESASLPPKIGRYVPLRRIGAGGMGVVYEASDPTLQRRVALKLVRPAGDEGSAARRRLQLLREAQALAQLSHPNVVPVFDVGESGAEIFLAMELVEGCDLGTVLRARKRGWRAVVDLFIEAGRGLAAAHRVGMVHRDFKPENVLVGDDGRVRVADFGLACTVDAPVAPSAVNRSRRGDHPGAVTAEGEQPGTPRYMAPELLAGAEATARSDQYSFCVALLEELTDHCSREQARDRRPKIPHALRRVIERGLEERPERRHPSMDALIGVLTRIRHRRRNRALTAAALGIVGVTILGTVAVAGGEDETCTGSVEQIGAVWNEPVRFQLRARAGAAGVADAAKLIETLDQYAEQWAAAHTDACRATRVYGHQSEALLDARTRCYERRLTELSALLELITAGDQRKVRTRAREAALRLSPLADCADRERLERRFSLPADASLRSDVASARDRLDRVAALRATGDYRGAAEVAGQVRDSALAIDYPPLLAEAELAYAELLDLGGDGSAEKALVRAAQAAVAAEDPGLMARAWVDLVYVIGLTNGRADEAIKLGELARPVVDKDGPGWLRGTLENHLGVVHYSVGQYETAREHYHAAVEIRRRELGTNHPDAASSLANLSGALASLGDLAEAAELARAAYDARVDALGEEHPAVALSLTNMARISNEIGRLDEAIQYETRALENRLARLGKEHPTVGVSLSNLGGYHAAALDWAEAARSYERANRIFAGTLPEGHVFHARAQSGLGEAYVHLGRGTEAMPLLERAVAALTGQDDPVPLADAEYSLALAVEAVGADGARARARTWMSKARDHYAAGGDRGAKWRAMADEWLLRHPAERL